MNRENKSQAVSGSLLVDLWEEMKVIRDNTTRNKTRPMAVAVIEEYNAARNRLDENTLTTKQVAERFGVSRQAVDRWVKSGSLKAYDGPPDVGRLFDPTEVAAFQPAPRGYRSHVKNRQP